MKYHGTNPVGLALAHDTDGLQRSQVLQSLDEFQADAQRSSSAATLPATYRRRLAAAECAALCAQVVKEFHAVCASAAADERR